MKSKTPSFAAPADADARRAKPAVVCYPTTDLAPPDMDMIAARRKRAVSSASVVVPPRDARCIAVPAGGFFRITAPEGYQVGDLNVWAADDLSEHFYSGKTRALHGTHLSTGDRMWSRFPNMRPMATVTQDTLDWYGWDADGGSVHDVIGTRCDPYTGQLLSGTDYHYCCHSNLTRALADFTGVSIADAEPLVHDVLNVFMCTGFTADTHQYFMKASPVRAGDYLEFFAEMDLIVGLSACPGGDCGDEHTSDKATCHPLVIDVFDCATPYDPPPPNAYDRSHGR
ncbi:DUF1989 domain-containing protein [Octadecabacter sp. 1_MG-2023]|uniref:urea carboxylase-associated family protein n=1 Tax=unclassified Octadecabacter TaxID=196158 RepID=UPI001C0A21B3|nr:MULTISPECIES: DUF1989 domain-containing protein [unclassified Octadecabacter]MBU2993846.1 DUF1989 domain-containing protein [Octadecabacter sp. B2R22]MDO6735308.1 DUF1989 domain-containing protein [Octadecabacter sp. 1_MG-2023]